MHWRQRGGGLLSLVNIKSAHPPYPFDTLVTGMTEATPSAEGVASVHGVQRPISPQVLTKDRRPPPLCHQWTDLSSLV